MNMMSVEECVAARLRVFIIDSTSKIVYFLTQHDLGSDYLPSLGY